MPTTSSASEANDAIRRLVDAQPADGEWPSEDYEILLVEWAAAIQGGIEPAA
ncbi:hypothetical protein OG204_07705 [Streptomyces sp. NBC_01387]|uniref:hypothetical protein n=1 Tax=unclassified Streptomyces TaxID=2593676 RepID=UPI00202534E9|nr:MULTISPECIES: hypothetical protein [unclassified Streptomyces]MCX4551829.1 hypothetical protein [Streptomyces sp. NBC_01500]WSC23193.1 hypothetical protein OIE60_27915 [Streptomyces sp. NBC_01766]WSV57104.1 hypothetical protein OG282_27335 [Streptomyces sp. NBC_01014]